MQGKDPLVTVICISYNQEDYIAETIESILMQKTTFPIEILIHDDASTDKTALIIRDYAKKHSVIKPVYEVENKFSKGDYGFIEDMYKRARGKYIAVCEGDDSWTDPEKLRRQADFLEGSPDYALCFHPVRVFYENQEKAEYIFPSEKVKSQFTVKKLLENNFIQTNSVMYRKQSYKDFKADTMPNDWYVHLYHAQYGKIGFINKVMADYRRHAGGEWWATSKNISVIWERHGLSHITLYMKFLKLYGENEEYRNIIFDNIITMVKNLKDIDKEKSTALANKAIGKIERVSESLILYLIEKHRELHHLEKESESLMYEFQLKENHVKNLEAELEAIKKSQYWKLIQRTKRFK